MIVLEIIIVAISSNQRGIKPLEFDKVHSNELRRDLHKKSSETFTLIDFLKILKDIDG